MPYHRSKTTKYFFALFVAIVLVYAYFEAQNMLYGPQIILNADEAVTVQEELIEISGTAKNVVEITLSGRPVFIDDSGVFVEKLLLAEGVNRFIFQARDKFGREERKVLEVVYQPPDTFKRAREKVDTIEEPLENN
ncbi:hypothetical protein CL652_01540 [bacterium]|nr:hypothetical protein [bacterium]|tara:strand:+ start:12132 stop:12539 length:408 start_codon:yes stop_codon:yes gene_type:complete